MDLDCSRSDARHADNERGQVRIRRVLLNGDASPNLGIRDIHAVKSQKHNATIGIYFEHSCRPGILLGRIRRSRRAADNEVAADGDTGSESISWINSADNAPCADVITWAVALVVRGATLTAIITRAAIRDAVAADGDAVSALLPNAANRAEALLQTPRRVRKGSRPNKDIHRTHICISSHIFAPCADYRQVTVNGHRGAEASVRLGSVTPELLLERRDERIDHNRITRPRIFHDQGDLASLRACFHSRRQLLPIRIQRDQLVVAQDASSVIVSKLNPVSVIYYPGPKVARDRQ